MAKIKVMMKQTRHFQLNCYFYSCLSLIKDNKQIGLEGIVQRFKKIEPYLKEQNRKRYRDIFTNSESEYPHWGGYAIGYWLVKQYLELNSHITWEQVMDKSMGEIIEKSMFGSNLDIKMPVL